MYKVIAGKAYDTTTAEIVRKDTFSFWGDPAGYEETLYKTPEGFYFLYTNGGERSPYTVEKITRMSAARAEAWLGSRN